MALTVHKPTSPGQRGKVTVKRTGLYKGRPEASLTEKKSKTGGRNNYGRITTRHRGGGHKQKYRIIDFKRNKDDITAKVERIEYDPNRSAYIALLQYTDGEKRYIIAPKDLEPGMEVVSGSSVPIKVGNSLPLDNIPVGTVVHNIEMKPGKGGQIARAAGTSARLVAKEGVYATLRLRSGEMRKIPAKCRATLGTVSLPTTYLSRPFSIPPETV